MEYNPKDLQSTLVRMRHKFTLEVFQRNPARMYALFCELAPGLRRQGKVLRRMGEAGLLRELYFAAERGNDADRLRVLMKARYWLTDYLQFSVEKANFYLEALNVAYDLHVTLPAWEPPRPVRKESAPPKASEPEPEPQLDSPSVILYGGRTGNRWWGNLRWTLDSNGTLTISGKGQMKDYTYDETIPYNDLPWKHDLRNIRFAVIESGVTSIGRNAFRLCANLSDIRIADSVVSIGERAFYGCTALTSVLIPDSVVSLGERAFYGCTALESVRLSRRAVSLTSGLFDACTSLTNVHIPDGVTHIGDWAFYDCASLKRVRVPDSVTSIGWYAFGNCRQLNNVNIPSGARVAMDAFDERVTVARR